jgi:hypothetical protein
MSANIASNHHKQKLLFFVVQGLDDNIRAKVRDFVLRLAGLRRWLNGPPRFVNSRDEPKDASRGDIPVETIGGYLEIYSALPPWTLPREIDLQHLEEVTALLNTLCDFSHEHNLTIELELDGELIGAIKGCKMDFSISEGLIGEWRRHLGL